MKEPAPRAGAVAPGRADTGELVERLRAGDAQAFAKLVQAHQASMIRVARLYVRDLATSEEVAQETWLALLRGIDRFEERSSLKTWLFQILVNLARTRAKREARTLSFSAMATAESEGTAAAVDPARFQGLDGDQPGHWGARRPHRWSRSPDGDLMRDELGRQLRSAIDGLPEAQRLVISLRDIEGWTSREVCNALRITETNQRVLLHRARSKARRALNDYVHGDLP